MQKTKKIVITSLFAALICVLTMFPRFPVPLTVGGYIHLGDALIIVSIYFIGIYAVPAAAIGSALADILSGYFVYSPATFIIKALMALVAFYIYKIKGNNVSYFIAALFAEIIMVTGYFLFEICIYGISFALLSLPYNFVQAIGGIILGLVFYYITKKAKLKEKL